MTLWEWGIVAAAVAGVITFVLFFIWPERTAVTFLLVFSTIRHLGRVRHELRTGKFSAPTPKPRSASKLSGTLSGYIADQRRDAARRLTQQLERHE